METTTKITAPTTKHIRKVVPVKMVGPQERPLIGKGGDCPPVG